MIGISSRAMSAIIVLITIVWAGSIGAQIFVKGFEAPSGVNEVMMVVVGFLFAGRQAAAAEEKKQEEKNGGEE
jgi:hypothetical protein